MPWKEEIKLQGQEKFLDEQIQLHQKARNQ
jgi:hypothetical protein